MSLATQKARLLQQVRAILIATTQTFGDRNRNHFVSFRQPGFPSIAVDNWLIVGVAFIQDDIVLIDERELHFQLRCAFDSSDLDELLSVVDTLHSNGLSATDDKASQYCALIAEHHGPALFPVTVVFHQNGQHLSTDDAQIGELSPDTLRQLVLQQGAWPVDENQPVEFSIYDGDDADAEWVSGEIHPAFMLK